MGDMADYFLNEVLDHEEDRTRFLHGELTHEEAYDRGVIDEHGTYLTPGRQHTKTCRYCGISELHWEKATHGKWQLYNPDNSAHICRKAH